MTGWPSLGERRVNSGGVVTRGPDVHPHFGHWSHASRLAVALTRSAAAMTSQTSKSELRRAIRQVVGIAVAAGLLAAGAVLVTGGPASAGYRLNLTAVPQPNPKAPGLSTPNTLSPELAAVTRAQGSQRLENPRDGIGYYGYDAVGTTPPMLPTLSGDTPYAEAHKTEPDKNTYLVLEDQTGPDASYDYGTHFLFQGHESGEPGYVTRVNLDADAAHRVTLLATHTADGTALPDFDGSTFNPFTGELMLSAEAPCNGQPNPHAGIWGGRPAYTGTTSTFHPLTALGSGGYEGVQTATDGSIWMVEDSSGPTVDGAKVANSFVYRFVPRIRGDLSNGRLQALQVQRADGTPIGFDPAHSLTADASALHTYGRSFATRWVTVHDTAVDGAQPFCANTAAKRAGATPFKRPENGVFRPGTGFGEFYFTETGDTSTTSTADNGYGGYGGVFRIAQAGPSADTGTLSLAFAGDREHTGLDNIAFVTADQLAVVEDAGDNLHSQRNALDSGYLLDVTAARPVPLRFLAEGRDPSATVDSALAAMKAPGFDNDGDNEITGIHVSNGDPTPAGLLGAAVPMPFRAGWRVFYTAQHGDNVTYELLPALGSGGRGSGSAGED